MVIFYPWFYVIFLWESWRILAVHRLYLCASRRLAVFETRVLPPKKCAHGIRNMSWEAISKGWDHSLVFKLADALSRPFHRHFPPSEHSDAKQITPPGNTRHRITPVKAPTLWNLPFHQDPQRKIPRAATFEQRQDIHPWTQDRTLSGTLFRHLQRHSTRDASPSYFYVSPAKILQSTKEFRHPASFCYVQRKFFTTPDLFIM